MASAEGHHAAVVAAPPVPDGETRGPVTIALTPLAPGEDPRVELAGIGAQLAKAGDALRVEMVATGGGAAEAGLAVGDLVTEIDGRRVAPLTLGEAIPLLRGPEGTAVVLGVVRDGARVTLAVPRRRVRA
jgi:C-terminal processing protease CtpA/Prc